MRKISVFFLITLSIILFVFSSITISADDEENELAADITDSSAFTLNGQEIDITKLRNGSLRDFLLIEKK